MPPRISIITPSFNQGRFIADAIESVRAQAHPDVEHIVVDAQSTDETREVLERHAHLPHLRWTSEPDDGQTDAINKGFRRATGDIVAWLNADDFYHPGAFERIVDGFREHPEADVLYGEAAFVDEDKRLVRTQRGHAFDYDILLYYGCYIPSTATFFRRRIVDAGHLLDASYRVTMDYEYFVRLAKLGYGFRFVPEVLASFRWHGDNVSTVQAERRRSERLQVQHQHGFKLLSNPRAQARLYDWVYPLFRLKRLSRRTIESFARRRGA